MVDNNFKFKGNEPFYDFSTFDINKVKNIGNSIDFVDISNNNILLYFVFRRDFRDNTTYIFKRNKIYNFASTWYDEIGNVISSDRDIWYDPFVFIEEKDLDQVIRYLKLNNLKLK